MLLSGKRILVTGIITDQSIAFAVAKLAQEAGATVVLTGYGRLSLVERIARRLPNEAPLIELDVTNDEHLAALPGKVREHVDGLDGVVHSIGYAPPSCLGGGFLDAPWQDVATALNDDLNAPRAVAALFEFVRAANRELDKPEPARSVARALEAFQRVAGKELLDVLPTPRAVDPATAGWIDERIAARAQARKSKDFKAADAIRAELAARGIEIEDTPLGTKWKTR